MIQKITLMIIARPIQVERDKLFVDFQLLKQKYPQHCKSANHVRAFLNRVFAEDGKVILQPRLALELVIDTPKYDWHREEETKVFKDYLAFDLTSLSGLGIAIGYVPEILIISFIVGSHTPDQKEILILPNELQIDCQAPKIKQRLDEENDSLRKISESFETIGLLHQSGNNEIAEDLTQGLLRFEKGDWEGAIKFFRKVVEAFRQHIQKEQPIEGSKNRTQAIQDFLSKSFGLLSNFGEHYGTHGAFQDAALARDLAIAISKFLA